MSTLSPWRRLENALLYALAALVLTLACLVTAARLALPQIDQYRSEIEALVSQFMRQPVAIGRIGAQWSGWTPYIEIDGIDLLSSQTGEAITSFRRLRFSIDALASLRSRSLVPGRLQISGLQLTLARNPDGGVVIEGVNAGGDQSQARQNALAWWLQQQPRLDVDSARITWLDRRSLLEPLVFSNVRLRIRNEEGQRTIAGSARLPQEAGEAFRFVLQWQGDLLRPDWDGEVYFEGRAINPALLLNYQQWMGVRLAQGQVDFRVWTNWEDAALAEVEGEVTARSVRLGLADQGIDLTSASGRLHGRRDQAGDWELGIARLNVSTAAGSWPESAVALSLRHGPDGALAGVLGAARFLRLEDIAPLLPSVEAVPAPVREAFGATAPRGMLRDLRVAYTPGAQPDQRLLLQATFDELGTTPWGELPGAQGVDGQIKLQGEAGELVLESSGTRLSLPHAFADPLELSVLQGKVSWGRREQAWVAYTPGLTARNEDLALVLSGSVRLPASGAPELDLAGRIEGGRVDRLARYLPHGRLKPRAEQWLTEALQGGSITGGEVVLRGPLAEFPFDANQGAFALRLTVDQGMLAFSRRWPRLEELEAEVLLEGRALRVRGSGARMLGGEILEASAEIADLGAPEKVVRVTGRGRLDLDTAREILAQSPLAARVGARLAGLRLEGDSALSLELAIPLKPEQRPTVSGQVTLEGQRLGVTAGPALEQAEGRIDFTRESWSLQVERGLYEGLPVRASIGSEPGGSGLGPLRLQGELDAAGLRERLARWAPALTPWLEGRGLLARLEGATPWEAELAFSQATPQAAPSPSRLTVRSGLQGLALLLPAPMGKTAEASIPFTLDLDFEGAAVRQTGVRYGDLLEARLGLEGQGAGRALTGASVMLGGESAPEPGRGIAVRGRLDSLALSHWVAFLDTLPTPPGGAAPQAAPLAPQAAPAGTQVPAGAQALSVDLEAGSLEAVGQWFSDTRVRLEPAGQGWEVRVDGPELAGRISVPASGQEPVRAQFDRMLLGLAPARGESAHYRGDPRRIPPMQLSCERFAFKGAELGRLELSTRRTAEGLALDTLSFRSPAATIDAQGAWRVSGQGQTSDFEIEARAEELSRLLATFGYAGNAAQGGKTRMTIKASWAGSPADFTLQGLDGTLALSVKDGRLLDIDPGQGRLFGLISLQTLPRRLSLDFSDIFEKGFAFDRIEGNFSLDEGNAYTNDLHMDGPAARVEVTGRTGLKAQDYDQIVIVTPKVSNALPVASAFFGPIGAAVGGVLLLGQEVFEGLPLQFDRMLNREYSVTGPWRDPVVSKLEGPTAASPGSPRPPRSAPAQDPG